MRLSSDDRDSLLPDEHIQQGRATTLQTPKKTIRTCAERLPQIQAVFPNASMAPAIPPASPATEKQRSKKEALVGLPRARMEGSAIVSEANLENLFQRGLLARIHRYTIKSLRNQIQTVSAAGYMRFLFAWHGMVEKPEGENALLTAIEKLEGFPIPAAAWESDILPSRIKGYITSDLDRLCSTGRVVWMRIPKAKPKKTEYAPRASKASLLRNTPIVLIDRNNVDYWRSQLPKEEDLNLSTNAKTVLNVLKPRRLLLHRHRPSLRHSPHPGRRSPGRTRRPRPCHLRQLRWPPRPHCPGQKASKLCAPPSAQ